MAGMHPQSRLIRFALLLSAALILSACAGAGPGWTYAPLGPSAAPTSAATATPAASPSLKLDTMTSQSNPLAFEPATLVAPANTVIEVTYLNDSSIPHNIQFFAGADALAESLGKTEVVTGPGVARSVIFTTPATPGDYYFWCDVHAAAMAGTLRVQ